MGTTGWSNVKAFALWCVARMGQRFATCHACIEEGFEASDRREHIDLYP